MAKRSYGQNCALARTSDLIGERWTLLLLRDLLISPRRFNELLTAERGMGTNLLASRLKHLEAAGLVEKCPATGGSHTYGLTARGRALEPAVLALIRWGLTHGPVNQHGDRQRDDWDLLALKAAFQPARAGDLDVTVQFMAEGFAGWVTIAAGEIQIGLGEAAAPSLVIDGAVADLFLGGRSPEELLHSGDAKLLGRFMRAFALRS